MTHETHPTPAPPPKPTSLATRLQAARRRAFIGRAPELATFRAALAEPERPLTVLFMTGPGGIGKSSLLRRFAQEATEAGREVLAVDAHNAECTPQSFLAQAGRALIGHPTTPGHEHGDAPDKTANGHTTNGHPANGRAATAEAPTRHAANGHSANGHAAPADEAAARQPPAAVPATAATDQRLNDQPPTPTGSGTVLLIDTFELYRPLEAWLREEFLPRLPLGTIVVFGGRARPAPEWHHDPAWDDLLEVIDVAELSEPEASALLTSRGVPEARQAAVLDFAGGNPLVLSLAAETAVHSSASKPSADDARTAAETDEGTDKPPAALSALAAPSAPSTVWTPSHDVIGSLVTRLVGDAPSPEHRHALDVCAQAHMTTETMLRSVLTDPETDTAAIFAWLRDLPFMESGPHGLYPHDVVREILDADLRWRDPERHRIARDRILTHIGERLHALRESTDPDAGTITRHLCANALHLQREGFGRASKFDGRRAGEAYADALRPGDHGALLDLSARTDSAEFAAIVGYWLARQPDAFRVVRRAGTREVSGFVACLRLTEPRPADLAADPLVAEAWAHAQRTAPLRPGEHILFVHSAWIERDPDPTAHLLGADLMALMVRSLRLAWSFVVVKDFETFRRNPYHPDPLREQEAMTIGGVPYWMFRTDRRVRPLRIQPEPASNSAAPNTDPRDR
jgi:hypothetical protein